MKGTEDLGDGLCVVFRLENGSAHSDGALNNNGRLLGRVATAGLSSVPVGTVTLGRQVDRSDRTTHRGGDLWFVVRDPGRSRQLRRKPRRQ
jgi:predicted porin